MAADSSLNILSASDSRPLHMQWLIFSFSNPSVALACPLLIQVYPGSYQNYIKSLLKKLSLVSFDFLTFFLTSELPCFFLPFSPWPQSRYGQAWFHRLYHRNQKQCSAAGISRRFLPLAEQPTNEGTAEILAFLRQLLPMQTDDFNQNTDFYVPTSLDPESVVLYDGQQRCRLHEVGKTYKYQPLLILYKFMIKNQTLNF